LAKTRELDLKKKELEMAKFEESRIEDNNDRMKNGMSDTQFHLKHVEHTHNMQLMTQRTYTHMVGRMKADLIAAKIK